MYMERRRLKLGRDGMRGLPPGFRFEPTEEELVFEYLKCKVFSSALPASIIPEMNSVCDFDPWDLPAPGGGGDWEDEERYLFSKNQELGKDDGNGKKQPRIRWTPSGYWKAKGSERKIVSSSSSSSDDDNHLVVGMKKTLAFYITTTSSSSISSISSSSRSRSISSRSSRKTGWVMHEYRLVSTQQTQTQTNEMEKWVVCRIFCNKLQFNYSTSIHDDALSDSVSSTASSEFTDDAATNASPTNYHSQF